MLKHTLKERIFTVLLAGVMTASVITSGCGMFNKESDSDKTSSSSTASQSDSDQSRVLDDDLVVKSENFSLSKNMVAYLFNHYYTSNLTYAEYYQGFDASKSPKDQYYDEENGVTWYDYYMSLTKQYLTQLLVHCEAAKAENMKLDEKDNKDVATTIDSIKKSAEDNNQTLEEYIKKNFGEGVTEESIKEYLEMTALASKYYEKIYNSYQYTDEDYEKYYSEHKTDYQFADFLRFTFSFASAPDSSADRRLMPKIFQSVKQPKHLRTILKNIMSLTRQWYLHLTAKQAPSALRILFNSRLILQKQKNMHMK